MEANNIGVQFSASRKWIYNFKKRNGVVSRKVTEVQSSSKMANEAKIIEAANNFRRGVLVESPKYSPQLTFNTDQSIPVRILFDSYLIVSKGEKKKRVAVKSMNKTTHSYTVQPTLGLDGKLHGPLYLCLQEVDGRMGERVEKNYFRRRMLKLHVVYLASLPPASSLVTWITFWDQNSLATLCYYWTRGAANRATNASKALMTKWSLLFDGQICVVGVRTFRRISTSVWDGEWNIISF